MFCTGNHPGALANNEAAELILKGEYRQAAMRYEAYLQKAPLFLPFRYNLGFAYYQLNIVDRALLHLTKAQQLVPEYYLVNIQLGLVCELAGQYSQALDYYRQAIRMNPNNLEAYIMVGNLNFSRNQLEIAATFYDAALDKIPAYPNAMLGRARIHFEREQYFKAWLILKVINAEGDYDKAFHYYYAECAYKLQKYDIAYQQYSKLLEFKGDRFFIGTSMSLIIHKQSLAKRFAQQMLLID
jgi:tetratricopeptide (TPR) repeat protein